MSKPFITLAPLVFAVIAIVQLVRVIKGWTVIVDGFTIPVWVSGAAFIFMACMTIGLWLDSRSG